MQIVLIILSVGFLGLIVYFAFSPKSSRFLKLAALIALGLIGLSLGIAVVFILLGFGEGSGDVPLPFSLDAPQNPVQRSSNIAELLVFLAILFSVLFLIIIRARRRPPEKGR